ncbi:MULTISPECIES: MalY/PatB family protein [unclassified Lacticaseibacillus]|uniref:MalY/PatB family protein n=1 Tax=unclassified Lacticaseibacillus TaxID=2759744 RepID=UPI0019411FB6|nr:MULTISPECIES: aminotransferase class I/II-fold pyridoxal phosphate-dependent enzyme [unclassified Lacticaseibacillus]
MGKVDFDTVVDRYGTYSTQWDYVKDRFGEANLLPFTISDMDFKAPQGVSDVLTKAASRGLFGYTRWNNPEFKGAITNWFKRRYDTVIDPASIVYSPSVIFSLAKLLEQFSQPGQKVLTFSPCYDAFINTVTANNRVLVQYNIDAGVDWQTVEQLFAREHPAIFLLCNPHNPLGVAWSDEDMQRIVALCDAYHVAIISDEIHMDVVRKGTQVNTLAKYFHELSVPKAVLTSASKAFNIPALGCSYALLPDALDREQFLFSLKQKNALSSVPYLGMLATIECYNNQEDWLDQLSAYIDQNFAYTKQFLADELNLDYQIPAATYLGWINIAPLGLDMTTLQHEMVTQQKVAIMDGSVYGNGGHNYLRFNLGAPKSKIEDGLNRLAKAVHALKEE